MFALKMCPADVVEHEHKSRWTSQCNQVNRAKSQKNGYWSYEQNSPVDLSDWSAFRYGSKAKLLADLLKENNAEIIKLRSFRSW